MTGAEQIAQERWRQIAVEGYTSQQDAMYDSEELIGAAEAYIRQEESYWPWPVRGYKPTTRIRDLVKAGALIAAEIDRLLAVGGK